VFGNERTGVFAYVPGTQLPGEKQRHRNKGEYFLIAQLKTYPTTLLHTNLLFALTLDVSRPLGFATRGGSYGSLIFRLLGLSLVPVKQLSGCSWQR
jgi:hypothetical protein